MINAQHCYAMAKLNTDVQEIVKYKDRGLSYLGLHLKEHLIFFYHSPHIGYSYMSPRSTPPPPLALYRPISAISRLPPPLSNLSEL